MSLIFFWENLFPILQLFLDELHFDDLDLDCDGNDDNGNDTNNGNEDFSMIETPSLVQGEGIEEFMSETPTWMRSNSS